MIRKEVTDFIDKNVTCRIPDTILESQKTRNPNDPRPIIAAEEYPTVTQLAFDAATARFHLQSHRYGATCWKRKNCDKCQQTGFTHLALPATVQYEC